MMEQNQQEKTKKKRVFYLIPILLFLAFVVYILIRTCMAEEVRDEVKDAVEESSVSEETLIPLSDSFEDVLEENLYDRYEFIDLDGLTTRVLGINNLNERYRLADGSLARAENERDTTVISQNLVAFYAFLEERGIDFLYLQAPAKETLYDVQLSPGYNSTGWKTVANMLSALSEAEVPYLDMNAWFEENGWHMEDVFFNTDHHWKPEASLPAAQRTMEILEQNGTAAYDRTLLQEDSYDITVLEDWFLGSAGKRVGKYYGGVDDISVYVPNFETEYSVAYLRTNTTNWTYADTPLDLSYLKEKDYFGSNPYNIYLYGDYPFQIVKNSKAPNAKRLLLFGDSFSMPYAYFLTSQFQEIYYVDLRRYTDGTLAQFVEEIQPDVAIMCIDPAYMTEECFAFGTEEYTAALAATAEDDTYVDVQSDVFLEAQDGDNNCCTVLCEDLEPGQTYTLTVDSTAYEGGGDQFVQMTLQNPSDDEAGYNRYFDANSGETQKWIFTVPEGDASCDIYVYAGTKGHTAGVSAGVTGITLRKGLFEE